MKAIFEYIAQNQSNSFIYRTFNLPQFAGLYHFHHEIELTYIESSRGKRFVGRNVSDYSEGDLVLIGSNVPHCWKSSVFSQLGENDAKAKVIQFKYDFFCKHLQEIHEMNFLKNLMQNANSGIQIKGKTRDEIVKKIDFESTNNSFQKFMLLLEILYLIAHSKEIELLDNQFSSLNFTQRETERFNAVFSFIIENFTDNITINKLAEISNLTATSFCRYFKKVTNKTPFEVILELRIKHACNLLKTSEKSVSEICFEAGFGNISHFNKVFKNTLQQTPLRYREMFPTT